ncbi:MULTISPECIES: MFS transporter [Actibacterium]|uniref:PAT family beta-lactamase induction signal transducer AmpG n=1 Tax=Actibacterium naphthalenivorans TaxID=1614693 RepID=A0A840C9T4_9RHOB|nr:MULTISPECIES: MFS transporter [Actibacterium]MBB4020308.1 PAT family beta-lactamase induction signal transducer AmpG [Actibacterium naphthalenivorans]
MALRSKALVASLVGLYVAQSVPLYMVAAALPPILRARGVDLAVIGAFGVLLAPWVFKFLWAPLIDRLSRRPAIGRKRIVLAAQTVTILCIAALALLDPAADAVRFFPILMLMSFSSATQDVAADGYAVEHLPPEQQHIGNAIQGGAVAAGVLLGGSGTLLLHDAIGWSGALAVVAALTLLILLPFVLLPESHARREVPVSARPASLRRFFTRPGAWAIFAFAILFRLPEGLIKSLEQSFLVDAGLSLSQIGLISGASAALVGLAGSAAGAFVIARYGLRAFFLGLVIARTLIFAGYGLADAGDPGLWPLVVLSAANTFTRYIEIVGLFTAFMRFSSLAQAGTDFTLLSGVNLLMYMVGSMTAGLLASSFGYGPVFWAATLLSGVVGTLALRLLRGAALHPPEKQATRSSAPCADVN